MINVYWTCLEKEFLRAEEPVNIYKNHLKNKPADLYNPHNFINQCPAIHDGLKNLYGLKSIYDYEMKYVNKELESKFLDQDFYNSHVQVRDMEKKFFSFVQRVIFFKLYSIEFTQAYFITLIKLKLKLNLKEILKNFSFIFLPYR